MFFATYPALFYLKDYHRTTDLAKNANQDQAYSIIKAIAATLYDYAV